jgi:hypothetical protein
MELKPELKQKLEDFIDALETEFGTLEGVEILLEHQVNDGAKDGFATVKNMIIYHLHKTDVLNKKA